MISHAELNDQQIMNFAIKLWNIIKKQGSTDAKVIVSTMSGYEFLICYNEPAEASKCFYL